MTLKAKSNICLNYSNFDLKKQVEMIIELLNQSNIYESQRDVEHLHWLRTVTEDFKDKDWEIYNPELDGIEAGLAKDYREAIQKLHLYMKEHGYKTERNLLLAQLVSVPNAIFHPDPENPKLAKDEICYIEVTDNKPIIARPRRFTWVQKAFLTAKTSIMIRQKKLEVSTGDFASALVLVPYEDRIKAFLDKWGDLAEEEAKKPENFAVVATWFRMCVDFRELNNKTISEVFPLPRIDDLLDDIPLGTNYYSLGDVFDAFFCIELAQESWKYTGFRTHDQHLQYCVMPQGGKNNPSRFCRAISKMFMSIKSSEALKYIDDILVHSKEFDSHLDILERIYECLIENL
jgi:hypothetical protein